MGFFIRLVPAEDVFEAGTHKPDDIGQPRFLVVSFTSDMSMATWMTLGPMAQSWLVECFWQLTTKVSRVHSDSLRTLVVGPGLCDDRLVHVRLAFDLAGTLSLYAESELTSNAEPGLDASFALLSSSNLRPLLACLNIFFRIRSSCLAWMLAGASEQS